LAPTILVSFFEAKEGDATSLPVSRQVNCSDFLWPLYFFRNPTFPTFAAEVVEYAKPALVG
jgi:hypothetical protein